MEHGISTPNMLINSLCTGFLVMLGKAIEIYHTGHLPPIVIESLQALSYAGAITVSCFTVYNFISKKRKK